VARTLAQCWPISLFSRKERALPEDTEASWSADRRIGHPEVPMPAWPLALGRGLMMKCPACGEAPAFAGYLKVRPVCPNCAAPLGRAPSDDAPPYVTLLISLHLIAVILVIVDRGGTLNYITGLAIFVPLIIILELALLQPVKGAMIAVLLKVNVLRPIPVPASMSPLLPPNA
jgi:uncharacterized protein (DUF983 family)